MTIDVDCDRNRSIIFVGPSLAASHWPKLGPEVEWRGPAKRGDIARAQRDGVARILIIDGYMVHEYPPSPMEIARALEAGVEIAGAASLGALRAVELAPMGMTGSGWVYQQFRERSMTADDELVVLLDGPTAARCVPLVNVRFGLERLVHAGQCTRTATSRALRELGTLYFGERTAARIREVLRMHGVGDAQIDIVLSPQSNIKAADAIDAIERWSKGPLDLVLEPTHSADRDPIEHPSAAGITRVADTTGLDTLGVPTASCVRPGTSDAIWVYSGKGLTREHAVLSAVMECVERTGALWDLSRTRLVSEQALRASGESLWGPSAFTEAKFEDYALHRPIHWVEAEVLGGGYVWVPAELVFSGTCTVAAEHLAFATRNSNGLGAGPRLSFALAHALEELVERHVVSCVEVRASHRGWGELAAMAGMFGLDVEALAKSFRDDHNLAQSVALPSLSPTCRELVAAFERAGLGIAIKRLPCTADVFVFGAACIEEVGFDSVLCTAGYAADIDPEFALRRALLELAQSRATDRQGAREDCGVEEKGRHGSIPQGHWLLTPSDHSLDFSTLAAPSFDDRLAHYERVIAALGLPDIAYVSFEGPGGTVIVRALVPGIETWHATAGESSLGPALRRTSPEQERKLV